MVNQIVTRSVASGTLANLLEECAQQHPDFTIYKWLADGEHQSAALSYAGLHRRAQAIAGELQSLRLKPAVALLLYRPGLEFIEALFGCFYADVIAVPAYAPGSNRDRPRIEAIFRDAGCGAVLTTADSLEGVCQLVASFDSNVRCLATDDMRAEYGREHVGSVARSGSIAYLQYTSGSTSDPKGVMVTHANVLENLKYIAARGGFDESSLSVNWLPHFHDMGLIYGVLQPLFSRFPAVLFSPAAFLHSPLRWLRAISQYRGTHCGGPNFAYGLCVERISEEERSLLDLSSWKVAFNGAEPVRHDTLERFANYFAACGFERRAFYPVYGLAEASLKVTSGEPGAGARICAVDAGELGKGRAVSIETEAASTRRIVSCGQAGDGHEVVIVDPAVLEQCPQGRVGEIWIAGPSVAAGYWGNKEATRQTFKAFLSSGRGPYLRSGDLGFLRDNELFITGRLKDCIIIRGRNHYPQDIEKTAEECHEGLRKNGSAAFSVEDAGEERLIIVSELKRQYKGTLDAVIEALRGAIAQVHELQVFAVVLIRSGSLPKTSSGKVQRHTCKMKWMHNELPIVSQSVLQISDLQDRSVQVTREMILAEDSNKRKTLVENYVRNLISGILHYPMDGVTNTHSLISLGVDSLAGTQLMQQAEKDFGVVIPVGGLLDQGIAQIAALILKNIESNRGEIDQQPKIQRLLVRPAHVPLSASQTQIWLTQQLFPENCAYNEHLVVHLRGTVDLEALQQAVTEMVRRHEILRTTFPLLEGHPYQSIQPAQPVALTVLDIGHSANGSGTTAKLRSLVLSETYRPFRLESDLPVRFTLLRAAEREHFLLMVAHHIACDGASLRSVVNELGTLYEGHARGQKSLLPEPTIQYADYAVWQQEWLQGEVVEQQLSYWRQHLSAMEPLELPADYPRPSVLSHEGAVIPVDLSDELTEKVKESSQREGVTLFMSLLAAFQVLLSNYSGQRDIAVGTAVANRNRVEAQDLIGCFVNTLVLRTDLREDPTLAEALNRARQVTLSAYQHQDVPFTKLVEVLLPERDMSRSPLFQAMLVFQPLPGKDLKFGDLTFGFPEVDGGVAKFDLSLRIVETTPRVRGYLEYSKSLFESSTIQRMVDGLRLVLEQMVTTPGRKLGELSLMTRAVREQVLVEWNQTAVKYPQKCLHELFEEQAARTPNAIALEYEGQTMTYEELNRRANQMGHYLKKLGVGAEVRVGICVERSLEMVIGLIGILKAGGAYVPLDPDYPAERLQFMAEDAQVAVLLTESKFHAVLSQSAAAKIYLRDKWVEISAESSADLGVQLDPQHLAYVIYTSGSTGRPKGVAIVHQGASVLMHWARDVFSAEELEGVLASTSICFDLSVFELFVPLSWGGRVILVKNALALPQWVGTDKVKLVNTVPSAMAELLRMNAVPASVRVVNLAGEALHRSLVQQIYEQQTVQRVFNLYGPSEDTTYSTYICLQKEEGTTGVGIGCPVANTQAYVLGEGYQPVPIGVLGELYLGGAGLARGYLNRPGLTAERFVPNPFSASGGERLYRTGDRVRWRTDGNLEFLGRLDHQVKLRGHRIELGEIEAALLTHNAVEQAVVVVREGSDGDKRLAAYVVIRPGEAGAEDAGDLRGYLRGSLPEYMVPSAIVEMKQLPLTPNGKVDRKALPEPEYARSREHAGPRNVEEEILCGIFADVLKLKRVGVKENFFELGGHSLLATQVISRVRSVFGLELPIRALFEAQTVAGLAEWVKRGRGVGQIVALPLAPVARDGDLPLSYAQQRLWFLDQLEPGSAAYNMPFALRLQGDLNRDALQKSFQELVRRHEVLRTSFGVRDGSPVQIIVAELELKIEEIDLRGLSEEEREGEARRVVQEEAGEAFDLGCSPLLRVKLLQMGEQEHVLLVNMHHIVSDGWSAGIMMREFSGLYQGYVEGKEAILPELKVQYADYAVWQRDWLQGEVLDEQLTYWKTQLADLQALELPTDRIRAGAANRRGGMVDFRLGEELTGKIKELSRREGVTVFMIMLAGLQIVLQRYSGQEEIVVGTDVANRNRLETENLIGFFINQLVLRARVNKKSNFRELLNQVREVTLGAYAHQDVPFEKLAEELQPERNLGRAPFFQVKLVLQNTPNTTLELPGLQLKGFEARNLVVKLDLQLTLEERSEQIYGQFAHAIDLFSKETVNRLAGYFQRALEGVAGNVEGKISDIELLSDAERAQLLLEWNHTSTRFANDKTIHELIEAQAELNPGAVAIVCGPQQITYRDLNQRANQLAHYLQNLGVTQEVRVGLCMKRSLEMVVALLGVLKAGAAYLPLDPDYPSERLALMLEDSQAPVLLTQEALLDKLPTSWTQVISVDVEWGLIEEESVDQVKQQIYPDNLAYVIYTSGSTGRPKGVGISHRGLRNYLQWAQSAYRMNEVSQGSVSPVHSSLGFDLTVTSIFPALLAGKCISLLPQGEEINALAGGLLEENTYSLVKLTPSHLKLLPSLLEGIEGVRGAEAFIIGGENLNYQDLLFWRQHCKGIRLINEYGPTETVVGCCVYEIHETEEGVGAVPIGKPIANTQVYVADEEMKPVPVGVIGELYIGGEGLARGYLNRPELTAERFVPNPFVGGREADGNSTSSSPTGQRLYRTGDQARWRADGNLEFLGRLDHQVKIRGFRIELGEIEAALQEYPGVRQAAVVAREEEGGEKRLVAYVLPAACGTELRSRELREHLQSRLPEYMVPSAYVQMEEFPLTVNGKLDHKRLPRPEVGSDGREQTGPGYVGPKDVEEEILCGIWEQVLKLKRVGVEENFFELGGHSLLATQVISRVRSVFGLELPIRALFEAQTVAGLAEWVKRGRGVGQTAALPLAPVARDGDLPLSYAQQRLWFLDQLEPGSAAYNIPFALRLEGELNRNALQKSFQELVRRHEVLRTSFGVRDGSPVQIIVAELELKIEEIDLRGLSEEEREGEARRVAQEEAGEAFDLGRSPLLRVKLLQLGEQEHVLLVNMHHIVSDGWSAGIMMREFSGLYQGYVEGKEAILPELKVQYADYAVWQRDWLQGEVLERQINYWRKQLAGVAVLELPTDRPRPAVMGQRGALLSFSLSVELLRKLRELSQAEGVTLYMTLLAGLQILLRGYSGQEDIAVGSPIAGRKGTETEGLIGFFINTLVLRTRVEGGWSFREMLKAVREVTLAAYEQQDVPFEKLVDELEVERDMSRSPLFQVAMVLQNAGQEELRLGGLKAKEYSLAEENRTAKFDLTWSLRESEEGLEGGLEYNTDLYERGTVERMVGRWERVLEQAVEDPGREIRRISLLRAGERETVVRGWRGARNAGGAERGESGEREDRVEDLGTLVAKQAESRPEELALVGEGCRLTYGELNREANQWGHYLRKRGVKSGERVGVCLEHAEEWVGAMLGVMKIGGEVVGLEVEEAEERMGVIVEKSKARVVITEKRLAGLFAVGRVELLLLEEHQGKIEQESEGEAGRVGAGREREEGRVGEEGVEGEDVALVLYRSGGKGEPVGVMIPHCALVGVCGDNEMNEMNGVKGGERIAQGVGFGEEMGCLEVMRALGRGACVVKVPRGGAGATPRRLAKLLREEKVTVWWARGRELERVAGEFPWALKSVREIVCVEGKGEEKRLQEVLEEGVLERVYGVSGWDEGGGRWMKYALARVEGGKRGEVKAENLRVGVKLYLLDEEMEPTAEGVVGEIYIGGGGLGLGYEGDGGLTAENFVPDPYSEVGGGRLYRTGERGRRRGEGELEYCGREDGRVVMRGRRVEAGEIEGILEGHRGVKEAAVVMREGIGEEECRLVGVIVREEGVGEVEEEELKEMVRERMPEGVELGKVMEVEEIKRRVDGRIDRRGIEEMVAKAEAGGGEVKYEEAGTEVEKILVEVWEGVLNVKGVGIHDNFFKLGGDSILSIQVVSRARGEGVELTPRQIFEKQTIAELAEVAGRGVKVEAEQGMVRGRVALLPFQRVFFAWGLARAEHFNQAVMLELKEGVKTELLARAVEGLVKHHDGLRMRYERGEGGWEQWCEEEVKEGLYERKDLRGVGEREREAELEKEAERVQGSLDLEGGRVMKVVEYEMGERGRRLLLVLHHLVVDGVSWRILLEDLERGYEQLQAGREMDLGRKTTSLRQWGERLEGYGRGEEVREELEYWGSEGRKQVRAVRLDYELGEEGREKENVVGTQRSVMEELAVEETRELLQEVPQAYNTQINDVLLTALGRVLEEWSGSGKGMGNGNGNRIGSGNGNGNGNGSKGGGGVLVDVEGHGREEIFADMDVSRTVGWFTSVYPVLLGGGKRGGWEAGKGLSTVKEQLRGVPRRGLGYGILRYMSGEEETRKRMEELPRAEIIFNYLGQVDQVLRGSGLFRASKESSGGAVAKENRRAYVLEVSGIVVQGKLQMNWVYSEKLHSRETIAQLARRYMECLQELIEHCRSEEAGGFTPSDFPIAAMTEDGLQDLAAFLK